MLFLKNMIQITTLIDEKNYIQVEIIKRKNKNALIKYSF